MIRISVIVPVLNEAPRLPALIEGLRRHPACHEVIVVDGGSDDGSPALARAAGAAVLSVTGGRGPQLRAGAAAACGEVLWFLHADSNVPAGALAAIVAALDTAPQAVGGNFRLIFDGGDRFSRWLTGFYAWLRRHGRYYGDSAIFIRSEPYAALGGIRPLPLMEDYDLNRRLERLGTTVCIGEPPLITSARRFRGRHPVAIVAGWLAIHALFHLGTNPAWLARIYRSDRGTRGG